MSRWKKGSTRSFLALNASIWTIFFTVYLSIYGSIGRFKSNNEELIDFRVIVLTFNRSESLIKTLRSIDAMELDGDRAVLEIWIDRSKSGLVDEETVEVAQSFNWTGGPTQVHIQRNHSGIRGQWIDSWTPTNDKELAVIVEDDLSLSRYAYRWLKAVHGFYGNRKDFAGTTLTSDQLVSHHISPTVQLKAPKNETVFMYSGVGSWGFSPKQAVWKRFQAWYHTHVNDTHFHPYVDGIRPTLWYKEMEKLGTSDSVWTQWFVYFTNMQKLFTIYNNLQTYAGDRNSCLSVNRREVGLHTSKKGREDFCKLLNRWNERFVRFSENITRLDWAGKKIVETSAHKRPAPQPIKPTSKKITKLDDAGKKVVEKSAHKRPARQPIKPTSKKITTVQDAGKKVVEKSAHKRPAPQPIKPRPTSKKIAKLEDAEKKVVEKSAHKRPAPQPIKPTSKKITKLDDPRKKVVETSAHERPAPQPVKSEPKKITKLDDPRKKVVVTSAHERPAPQPIKSKPNKIAKLDDPKKKVVETSAHDRSNSHLIKSNLN